MPNSDKLIRVVGESSEERKSIWCARAKSGPPVDCGAEFLIGQLWQEPCGLITEVYKVDVVGCGIKADVFDGRSYESVTRTRALCSRDDVDVCCSDNITQL